MGASWRRLTAGIEELLGMRPQAKGRAALRIEDRDGIINDALDVAAKRSLAPKGNVLPVHADEAAAVTAGLRKGDIYQTATGEVRIKL
jgi:hypothetical protein